MIIIIKKRCPFNIIRNFAINKDREHVKHFDKILFCEHIMGKHYLSSLFEPQSVAVFGASDRID